MVKYEAYLTEDTHVHINTVGNNKLGKGIWNISLLPGDKPLKGKNGNPLTNIPGTCHGVCKDCEKDCYAIKFARYHHNSCIPAYNDNTILATHDVKTFFDEIDMAIKRNIVAVIRFHVSGEIPNTKYFKEMISLAKRNEHVRFYLYTKRYNLVNKYAAEIPNNMAILFSVWDKPIDNPYKFPTFELDRGNLKDLFHCPATDKKGHETGITCAMCKRCIYAKNGDRIAVYLH